MHFDLDMTVVAQLLTKEYTLIEFIAVNTQK